MVMKDSPTVHSLRATLTAIAELDREFTERYTALEGFVESIPVVVIDKAVRGYNIKGLTVVRTWLCSECDPRKHECTVLSSQRGCPCQCRCVT